MMARQILELLTESRLEYLKDKYLPLIGKNLPSGTNWADILFNELWLKGDPTSRAGNPGSYSEWIIRQYLEAKSKSESDRFKEDLYKVTEDLKVFDKIKHKLPVEQRDINKLTTQTLYDIVKPFVAEVEQKEMERPGNGADLLYQDSTAKVYSLKNHAAAVKLGRGTRWCTSADSAQGAETFANYLKSGQLIVIVFSDGTKYQFQDNTARESQFMDSSDSDVKFEQFKAQCSPQLIKFLSQFDACKSAEIKGWFKAVKRPKTDQFLYKLVTKLANKYPKIAEISDIADLYRRKLDGDIAPKKEWIKVATAAHSASRPSTYGLSAPEYGIRAAYFAASATAAGVASYYFDNCWTTLIIASKAGIGYDDQLEIIRSLEQSPVDKLTK